MYSETIFLQYLVFFPSLEYFCEKRESLFWNDENKPEKTVEEQERGVFEMIYLGERGRAGKKEFKEIGKFLRKSGDSEDEQEFSVCSLHFVLEKKVHGLFF